MPDSSSLQYNLIKVNDFYLNKYLFCTDFIAYGL